MNVKNLRKIVTVFSFSIIVLQGVCSYLIPNEGDRVEFVFCHRSVNDNCSIEIYKPREPPFYTDGTVIESALSGDQFSRFSVHETIKSDIIETHVIIQSVSRNDGGTYRCSGYSNSEGERKICKEDIISLTVIYPPGKAQCSILPVEMSTENDEISHWIWIECLALVGSSDVDLKCYQHGRFAPPVRMGKRSLDDTKFLKTMWMEKGQPIHCCSYPAQLHKSEADCNDFTYHRNDGEHEYSKLEVSSKTAPITITTTTTTEDSTRGQLSNTEEPSTTLRYVANDNILDVSKWQLEWSGPVIGIVIILGIIALCAVMCFVTKMLSKKKWKCRDKVPPRPEERNKIRVLAESIQMLEDPQEQHSL